MKDFATSTGPLASSTTRETPSRKWPYRKAVISPPAGIPSGASFQSTCGRSMTTR